MRGTGSAGTRTAHLVGDDVELLLVLALHILRACTPVRLEIPARCTREAICLQAREMEESTTVISLSITPSRSCSSSQLVNAWMANSLPVPVPEGAGRTRTPQRPGRGAAGARRGRGPLGLAALQGSGDAEEEGPLSLRAAAGPKAGSGGAGLHGGGHDCKLAGWLLGIAGVQSGTAGSRGHWMRQAPS